MITKRIGYGLFFLSAFCVLFSGCASFRSVNLNQKIKSGQLHQKMANFIVLFDNSASMTNWSGTSTFNDDTCQKHAQDTLRNMIATIPEIKLFAGLRTFDSEKSTLLYGMKSLVKKDYINAINAIKTPKKRSPLAIAITEAGDDLKWAKGNSAIIIVSDFSDIPGINDIHHASVIKAITEVNAQYGDELCVYAIQIGYTALGKKLSEQIVQNVKGGYNVNADKLTTSEAMAAFVEKLITGNCSRYQHFVAKPKEKIFIAATEPIDEKKVAAAVSETKDEEKVLILAFEDIHFDPDKATLKPEAQMTLKRNIQILKDNPKVKVRLAGYTSASGDDVYNYKLSKRRASSVLKYLINEGVISRDRLSTIGYGETDPAMYEAAPKEVYSKAAKANMKVIFEIVVQ